MSKVDELEDELADRVVQQQILEGFVAYLRGEGRSVDGLLNELATANVAGDCDPED